MGPGVSPRSLYFPPGWAARGQAPTAQWGLRSDGAGGVCMHMCVCTCVPVHASTETTLCPSRQTFPTLLTGGGLQEVSLERGHRRRALLMSSQGWGRWGAPAHVCTRLEALQDTRLPGGGTGARSGGSPRCPVLGVFLGAGRSHLHFRQSSVGRTEEAGAGRPLGWLPCFKCDDK